MLKVNHHFNDLESIKYDSVSICDVNQVVGMPVIKQCVKNGRVSYDVVFEETPIEKMHEGLSVDDFALENLLANGYQLKRVDFDNHTLDTIDDTVNVIDRAGKAISNAKSKLNENIPDPDDPENV